ncbi:MAG: DUF4266 domain-containing protein [Polyangiaceae bacterium]|nr:DUF4266 domain-containing protein [Polyangiaceae bacterium]
MARCLPAVIAVALLSAGCARVAPYARGRLAHPSMDPSADQGPGRAGLHAVQEGAIGGVGTRTSGCGCN